MEHTVWTRFGAKRSTYIHNLSNGKVAIAAPPPVEGGMEVQRGQVIGPKLQSWN